MAYSLQSSHVVGALILFASSAAANADASLPQPADGGYNPGIVTAQRLDLPEQKNRPGAWVTAMDFPTEALRQERGGVVVTELTVGQDGAVTDCRVVVSSRFPPLDAKTCAVFKTRARYIPARDASGNPVPSAVTERLRWVIPN